MYLGLACAAVMSMTVSASAEETELAGGTAVVDETEAVTEEAKEAAADVQLTIEDKEILISNETGVSVDQAELEETDEAEKSCSLILKAGDDEHIFEQVSPDDWTDPVLVEEQGFWYIQYTDQEGNTKEAVETAEAVAPEEEMSVWALTAVNMRAEASASSDVVAVVGLGDECKVLEILPGWYQVEYQEVSGFINHRFLSADKADAEAAALQEKAAAEAAAAAAAQQSANTYSYSGKKSSSSGKKNSSNNNKKQEECLTNGLLN